MCPNGPLPNQFGYSVSANIFGYSNAKQGNAYVGLAALPITGGNSEYIYQLLSNPLQAGKNYCLSFFISRADRKEYALKNIGAYFSISTPTMVSGTCINYIPQIINQNGFIADTTQWVEIQGCYTALGGEQYITIGNFNGSANIDTLYVGTNNPIPSDPKYSYYYIDEITLYDQSTVGLNDLEKENNIEIYPNPCSEILNIKLNILNDRNDIIIKITDMLGKEVLVENYKEKIDLSGLEQGIYFLSLYQSNMLLSSKKVIKK